MVVSKFDGHFGAINANLINFRLIATFVPGSPCAVGELEVVSMLLCLGLDYFSYHRDPVAVVKLELGYRGVNVRHGSESGLI